MAEFAQKDIVANQPVRTERFESPRQRGAGRHRVVNSGET